MCQRLTTRICRQFFTLLSKVVRRSILLRGGATLPAETDDAYLLKVRAAGSFQNYERAHLNAIAATFAPKFSHLLPPELVRRVVAYAFHVGDY